MQHRKMTMGVIVGNRGFFPAHLAKSGREEMIAALERAGMDCVVLDPEDKQARRRRDARRGQALRRRCSSEHADRIDGVIVTLPNFGDERAIADTLRLAQPRRAGAGAGDARRRRQDDASRTAATASAARCRPATTCASTASPTR